MERKLGVYKGTTLMADHALLDVPVAIASYYPNTSVRLHPCRAVGLVGARENQAKTSA